MRLEGEKKRREGLFGDQRYRVVCRFLGERSLWDFLVFQLAHLFELVGSVAYVGQH